jgi:hypothetical protein
MLGKLSILGTVAVILMIPTAPCAQMGGAVIKFTDGIEVVRSQAQIAAA